MRSAFELMRYLSASMFLKKKWIKKWGIDRTFDSEQLLQLELLLKMDILASGNQRNFGKGYGFWPTNEFFWLFGPKVVYFVIFSHEKVDFPAVWSKKSKKTSTVTRRGTLWSCKKTKKIFGWVDFETSYRFIKCWQEWWKIREICGFFDQKSRFSCRLEQKIKKNSTVTRRGTLWSCKKSKKNIGSVDFETSYRFIKCWQEWTNPYIFRKFLWFPDV